LITFKDEFLLLIPILSLAQRKWEVGIRGKRRKDENYVLKHEGLWETCQKNSS
jgi:hypothetical protein